MVLCDPGPYHEPARLTALACRRGGRRAEGVQVCHEEGVR